MNRIKFFVISILILGAVQTASAQNDKLDMELEVTDEEKIILFSGFIIAIIGIFLFLARDVILRKKTSYDKKDLGSKQDKTYEKYHSDWGEDYEELGKRKNTKESQEFREEAAKDSLPNYYGMLGVTKEATQEEIKTKENSEEKMAELNKAYEVLSDIERREAYDKYLKIN